MIRIPAPIPMAPLRALLLVVLASSAPLPLLAQDAEGPFSPPRWWAELDLLAAAPQGAFGERVDDAWGFLLGGRFLPRREGPLALRLDVGLMRYGDESRQVCLPAPIGCRVGARIDTNNEIYLVGAGPELQGWGGRLYAFATLGASIFSTNSSLSGLDDDEAVLSTTNQQDAVLALRGGAGVRIPLKGGPTPIRLELGAEYHRNGTAEYLVEGDLVDNPDGSITIYPNRTEANVLAFRIGVSFGIGSGPEGGEG
ncbi:MAG TPA: hypothetical protein VLA43_03900 [Longimicrobiales bacterium]|nr:hypothetical protein [Longimicrobiales bacterium]